VIELIDAGAPPSGAFAAWREEAIGRLAAHRGELERAHDAFQRCGTRAEEVLISNPGLFPWRSEAGLAAVGTGDHELARRLIGEERALAERFGAPRAIGVARRAAGLVTRGEEAVSLLRSAADLHAGCGARVEHARSLTGLGGAIRRAGRPAQARAPLQDAIALADRLGARTIARQARTELVLAGGDVPAARDRTGELTPSERRVTALAADGRTNREIANALFVTVKAVEWHLGNAYRKLDVRGRHHLRDALSALDGERDQ
jgi:DNA-binding CsgD family transcriptional regulator